MRRLITLACASAALFVPAAAAAAETITYVYDARGRLTQVSHANGPAAGVVTTYAYDKANNRITKTISGVP